jgi:predicted PurR-regulated permease PerM
VKVESGIGELVTPVVAIVTPAASQTVLFVAALIFFLIGQVQLRNFAVSLMSDRDAKLRYLKIVGDVERNLASYLGVVTVINATLGIVVGLGTWLVGLPNPVFLGLLAMILNYIPYVGPAITATTLLAIGLVVFPSIGGAAIAPVGFVMVTALEGLFFTPMIVGRQLTLNPLAVFLAVAFWGWLWGPFGALLAVPLSIVGLVTMNHLFPEDNLKLPE